METSELFNWTKQVLLDQNLHGYEINISGTTSKTDGYMSDINFIEVTNGKKSLNFVIKNSKRSKTARDILHFESFFKDEIHVYETILPTFRQFQIDRCVKNVFDSYPKFYKAMIEPDKEVLVLENLKPLGYHLHDRTKTLNFDHLKIVLTEYGKFHAISFAMKDQLPQEYDNLLKNTIDTIGLQFNSDFFCGLAHKECKLVLEVLKNRQQHDIYERHRELLQKDILKEVRKCLATQTSCAVISHGDAWINNYLFLYEDSHKISPVKIAFIDWQLSTVRCSPVFDLSQFLYCCSSPRDLDNLENLLSIYYESFSNALTELGSDPEVLYTFEDLKTHWDMFSVYGACLATFILKLSFWDSKDAPDMDTLFEDKKGEDLENVVSDIVITDENYYKRLVAIHRNLFFNKWSNSK